MKTYTDCPNCLANDVEIKFELHRADDGDFWVLEGATCLGGCDLTGDQIEKLDEENQPTMEDVASYYEPSY